MSEATVLHTGTLGPHAAMKLVAAAQARAQLEQAMAKIDAQTEDLLATVAEAQGFVLEGCRVKFDYDAEAGTYRVLGAPEEATGEE